MKQLILYIGLVLLSGIYACSDKAEPLSDENAVKIVPQFSYATRSTALNSGIVPIQISELNHITTLQQNTYDLSTGARVDAATAATYGDSDKDLFVAFPNTYFFRLFGNVNGSSVITNADIPSAFVGDKVIALDGKVDFNMRPMSCAVVVKLQDKGDNPYTGADAVVSLDGFEQVSLDVMAVKDANIRIYDEVETYLKKLPTQETFSITEATVDSIFACNIRPCKMTIGNPLMTIVADGKTYSVKVPQEYILFQGKRYTFTIRLGISTAEVVACDVAEFVETETVELTNTLHIRYNATDDVYEIFTPRGLKAFADIVNGGLTDSINCIPVTPQNTAANGKLMRNMDMYYYANWKPIGTPAQPYTGRFDGNNRKINYLMFADVTQDNMGLFGYTQKDTIKNIQMYYAKVQGNENVGMLVGQSDETVFESCTISSGVIFAESKNAGSMIGRAKNSTFTSCQVLKDTVGATKNTLTTSNFGGFVGLSEKSNFTNCSVADVNVCTGDGVQGYGYENKGGFVGCSIDSKYAHCQAAACVSYSMKAFKAGGFCGVSNGSYYTCCLANGTSIRARYVAADEYLGGFVGYSVADDIEMSCATIVVGGYDANLLSKYVGGFAGYIELSQLTACRADNWCRANSYIGGMVGYMKSGMVSGCVYTSTVSLYNNPQVIYVANTTDPYRGALVGYMEGGTIQYSGSYQTIGLVGYQDPSANVTECENVANSETIWNKVREYTGTATDGADTYTMTLAWVGWNKLWWQ